MVTLAYCLPHIEGNHSHIRQHRSRIELGTGQGGSTMLWSCMMVGWVPVPQVQTACFQSRIMAACRRGQIFTPGQLKTHPLQGDQKTSMFTNIVCTVGRLLYQQSLYKEGYVGESGSWWWALGRTCGKWRLRENAAIRSSVFSNLLLFKHFPAHLCRKSSTTSLGWICQKGQYK